MKKDDLTPFQECQTFMAFLSEHLHGVGRKGSEEAMRKLGAEPISLAIFEEMD